MKKYGVLAASFVLILFFQNCAPPQNVTDPSNAALPEFKTIRVENFNEMTVLFSEITDTGYSGDTRYYHVKLETGTIETYLESDSNLVETVCLNQVKLADLRSILEEAEICEPLVEADEYENQVCSTVVQKPPYAILSNLTQEYRLGAIMSSCDRPTDLCGERAGRLKSWADHFLMNVTAEYEGGVHPVLRECSQTF